MVIATELLFLSSTFPQAARRWAVHSTGIVVNEGDIYALCTFCFFFPFLSPLILGLGKAG